MDAARRRLYNLVMQNELPESSEPMKKHYEGSIAPLGTENWSEPCDAFAATPELAAKQVLEWNLKCEEIDEDQIVNVCVREITAAGDPITDEWEYLTGRAWVEYGSKITSIPIANDTAQTPTTGKDSRSKWTRCPSSRSVAKRILEIK